MGLQEQMDNRRIAVLPFANMSPDARDEIFADGMTEELISTLSKIAGLRVIARTSVMRYKDSKKPIGEISKELNVSAILEGSVRKAGNKIRITIQLADPETEEQLWSEKYDRDLEDIFAVQSEIAQKVAHELEVQIKKDEKLNLGKKTTDSKEAYSLYLEGRHFLSTRTEESLRKAIERFEKALEKDPQYALAYTGVADSYAVLALLEFVPPKEAFPKARTAAEKALEIDSRLAEAHTSLGVVRFQYDWDWEGSEKELKRAIELNPSYAPAHQFYADFLKSQGRFDEALSEMGYAGALDPLSLSINTGIGHVLYLSRQYDRAIEQYRNTIKLDPNFIQARLWFGRPYLQKRMYKEAIAELSHAVDLSGESTISLAMLGHANGTAGRNNEAKRILEKLMDRSKKQYVPSYWIAMIHVGLGDKNNAFMWLERAFQERSSWLVWARVEPRFDTLRADRRLRTMLLRMRLIHAKEDVLGIRGWLKGPGN
ncbi:MAG TPA: tetratricopeptide repeat protein [Candidatus Bathyarchaeia archaeon]|nr:tetratricopeptide repeat protein [Candidatus Bathyarchaeia archaeon]